MQMRQTFDEPEPESPLSEIDARFSATRSQLNLLEGLISKLTERLTPVINAVPVPGDPSADSDHAQLSPLAEEMYAIEARVTKAGRRIAELLDQIAL